MNNGQINGFKVIEDPRNPATFHLETNPSTFKLEVVGRDEYIPLDDFGKLALYCCEAPSPFKRPPADLPLQPTQEINEMVEQVLDMSIEEQNLLLSLLHRKITDQREAKIKELAQEQKEYENALNFFEKFK